MVVQCLRALGVHACCNRKIMADMRTWTVCTQLLEGMMMTLCGTPMNMEHTAMMAQFKIMCAACVLAWVVRL
jgi:hypothetical protein